MYLQHTETPERWAPVILRQHVLFHSRTIAHFSSPILRRISPAEPPRASTKEPNWTKRSAFSNSLSLSLYDRHPVLWITITLVLASLMCRPNCSLAVFTLWINSIISVLFVAINEVASAYRMFSFHRQRIRLTCPLALFAWCVLYICWEVAAIVCILVWSHIKSIDSFNHFVFFKQWPHHV